MRTRMLFSVGLVFLILALGGLVLRFTRFPRTTFAAFTVTPELLLPPTPTPAPTPTHTSDTPMPTAVISGPTSGRVGRTLFFSGADSTDDGSIVSYAWDFGDGTTGSGVDATHVYTTAGSCKVTLTVTDDGGLSDSATHDVQIVPLGENQPPKAVIRGPTSGRVGERLSFSGADSTDPDGRIESYAWDFGDGTTGSGVNVTHSYEAVGSYKVTLTVTDDGIGTAQVSSQREASTTSRTYTVQSGDTLKEISRKLFNGDPQYWDEIADLNDIKAPYTIQPGQELEIPNLREFGLVPKPPKAVISGPTSGRVGERLSFSGADSTDPDGRVVSYAWDFGDGTTGSGVDVTHVYTTAGSYKVTLTVTDDVGARGQASVQVFTTSGDCLDCRSDSLLIDFASYIWAKAGTLPHVWSALPTFSVWTYSLDSQDDDLSGSATQNVSIYELTARIEAEWPEKMEVDRSDSIRVSLVCTTDQVFTPTSEIAGHAVLAGSPVPVGGTPEAPIQRAFGEYEAFAKANLYASVFEVSPPETKYQSLEQPRTKWDWNWSIVPKESDWQSVIVNMEVQWEPPFGSNGQPIPPREIWCEQLDIYVKEPLVTMDQISVGSLLSGFIGSALTFPWLCERIKEKREKRQKGEESKPKIYLP